MTFLGYELSEKFQPKSGAPCLLACAPLANYSPRQISPPLKTGIWQFYEFGVKVLTRRARREHLLRPLLSVLFLPIYINYG